MMSDQLEITETLFSVKIFTPSQAVVDEKICSLIAEDRSGYFGIQAGHINLLTVLVPTILRFRKRSEKERYIGINGGILKVENGSVTVAAREAIAGEKMAELEEILSIEMAKEASDEKRTRISLERMGLMIMRNFLSFERIGKAAMPSGE
jgi:F-type H+-transporting ATPase subunit epsilon